MFSVELTAICHNTNFTDVYEHVAIDQTRQQYGFAVGQNSNRMVLLDEQGYEEPAVTYVGWCGDYEGDEQQLEELEW